MEEVKKEPSEALVELGKEYSQLAAFLGENEYKIKVQQEESLRLIQLLKEVNNKAAVLKAKEGKVS